MLIAFTAAAALSCQPQRTLDLVVTPGDLLIVAKVDIEEGSISLSKIVADRSVIPAHRKASEVLITWSLPKGSLVDSEGAPLDPAELVLSRTSTLGCGHCPIQSRVAPQIFDPGANCPLPGWLDAPAVVAGPSANPEHVVAELAPTLRLHRRGACPCERLDPTIDGGTIDARYLDTRADPEPATHMTGTEDGALVFAGRRVLGRIETDGRRRVVRMRRPGDDCGPPVLPFTAGIQSMTGLGDGHTLVANAVDDVTFSRTQYTIFDRDLQAVATFELPLLPVMRPLVATPLSDGRIALAGRVVSGIFDFHPGLVLCAPRPGYVGLSCNEEFGPRDTLGEFHGIADLPGTGWLIASTSRGAFAYGSPKPAAGSRTWTFTQDRLQIPRAPFAPATVPAVTNTNSIRRIHVVGQHAFACALHRLETTIITASVSAAGLARGVPTWQGVHHLRGTCGLFQPRPEPGVAMRFTDGRTVVDFDARGRPIGTVRRIESERYLQPWELVGDKVYGRRTLGSVAFIDANLDRPGVATTVYGADPNPAGFGAVATVDDDEIWAFGDDGTATVVDPRSADPPRVLPLVGFASTDTPLAAEHDRSRERFIVTGTTLQGASWLRWVGHDGQAEAVSVALEMGEQILDATVTGRARALAITTAARVLLVEGGDTRAVPIEWDDPVTMAVEAQPGPECCLRPSRRYPVAPDDVCTTGTAADGPLRAIDANGAVALVTGCEGLLLRVASTSAGLVARRVAPPMSEMATLELMRVDPTFGAVRVGCPDDALLIHAVPRGAELSFAAAGFRLTTDVGPALTIESWEGNDSSNLPNGSWLGAPVDAVGLRPGITAVWSGGRGALSTVHRYIGGSKLRFPIPLYGAAQTERGDGVLISDEGRVIVTRQCD